MREHEFYDLVWHMRREQIQYWRISCNLRSAPESQKKQLMAELDETAKRVYDLECKVDKATEAFYGVVIYERQQAQQGILK